MKNRFKFFLFLVSLFAFLSVCGSIQAQESTIVVDHVATGSEKIREKITLFLKFNKKDKAEYNQFLLEKRLAELSYVVNAEKFDSLGEVSSRYTTYLGRLSNYLEKNKILGEKGDVLKMLDRHKQIVELMQKKFEFESAWWIYLQHGINSIEIFSDKLQSL